MSKALLILIFGLISAISVVALLSLQKFVISNKRDTLERTIATAHLIGRSPLDIDAFLDKQKIPYGQYDMSHANKAKGFGGTIYAGIHNAGHTFSFAEGPQVWDIVIGFQFDDKDKLIRYRVSKRAVGF